MSKSAFQGFKRDWGDEAKPITGAFLTIDGGFNA